MRKPCEKCDADFEVPPDFPHETLCSGCAEERLWDVLAEKQFSPDFRAVQLEIQRQCLTTKN